jgi:hypothetical protein
MSHENMIWITGNWYEDQCKFVISRLYIILMRNRFMEEEFCREKSKLNGILFPKIVLFLLILKYATVRQVTHNNVTLVGKCVIFIPDNKSKIRDTHILFNNFYLTASTMVTRACINVTLQVHFLSCWFYSPCNS